MTRSTHKLLFAGPTVKYSSLLLLMACAIVFLVIPALLPVHRCDHHHEVSAPIGSCHCVCHSLSAVWHHGSGPVLLFCLIANVLFGVILHQILPFRRLEYRESLQRAPPIISY